MDNKWLTIDEAAEKLSCSKTHIRRMISAGKLPSQDIGLGKHAIMRVQIPEAQPNAAQVMPRRKKYIPQVLTK